MDPHENAPTANARAAAESAKHAATAAGLAEIDAKYARSGDLAGFLREVGAAELTLVDLADWLAAAGASGVPKFAVGGMLPKDFVLGQVRIGEATVPAASNPWPEMLVASREIVRLNTQMARLLERWDSEGLPCRRGEV